MSPETEAHAPPHCLFCKIASGDVPAERVYEDEQCMAFRDIHPAAPVHILIVPRLHLSGIAEAAEHQSALLGRLMLIAAELARRENLEPDGYRLVVNSGENAGQSVPHLHLHLLGGRRLSWPPG